jgi:hypothetical protein
VLSVLEQHQARLKRYNDVIDATKSLERAQFDRAILALERARQAEREAEKTCHGARTQSWMPAAFVSKRAKRLKYSYGPALNLRGFAGALAPFQCFTGKRGNTNGKMRVLRGPDLAIQLRYSHLPDMRRC